MHTPDFVIEPHVIPSLPVAGESARFPVARIFCVGRNYAEHAREMGHNPDAEPPFFFMKPATAILAEQVEFPYPSLSADVHHEVELVVALKEGGSDIPRAQALTHVYGYAVGIDMTRRDLQAAAKKAGRPWESGKAFDHSAPCSAIVPAARIGHPAAGPITLTVNGEIRQSGDLAELIWDVPSVISYLSTLFELRAGDLIFTGTPAGVGAIKPRDELVASIASVGVLNIRVR